MTEEGHLNLSQDGKGHLYLGASEAEGKAKSDKKKSSSNHRVRVGVADTLAELSTTVLVTG